MNDLGAIVISLFHIVRCPIQLPVYMKFIVANVQCALHVYLLSFVAIYVYIYMIFSGG